MKKRILLKRQRGVTLIELVTAAGIIAAIAGVVAGAVYIPPMYAARSEASLLASAAGCIKATAVGQDMFDGSQWANNVAAAVNRSCFDSAASVTGKGSGAASAANQWGAAYNVTQWFDGNWGWVGWVRTLQVPARSCTHLVKQIIDQGAGAIHMTGPSGDGWLRYFGGTIDPNTLATWCSSGPVAISFGFVKAQ